MFLKLNYYWNRNSNFFFFCLNQGCWVGFGLGFEVSFLGFFPGTRGQIILKRFRITSTFMPFAF